MILIECVALVFFLPVNWMSLVKIVCSGSWFVFDVLNNELIDVDLLGFKRDVLK